MTRTFCAERVIDCSGYKDNWVKCVEHDVLNRERSAENGTGLKLEPVVSVVSRTQDR